MLTCGLGLKTRHKRTSPFLGRFLILGSATCCIDEGLPNCWVEITRTFDTPLLGRFFSVERGFLCGCFSDDVAAWN
jgi:hypothetical protein